jgi:hypothetical protein
VSGDRSPLDELGSANRSRTSSRLTAGRPRPFHPGAAPAQAWPAIVVIRPACEARIEHGWHGAAARAAQPLGQLRGYERSDDRTRCGAARSSNSNSSTRVGCLENTPKLAPLQRRWHPAESSDPTGRRPPLCGRQSLFARRRARRTKRHQRESADTNRSRSRTDLHARVFEDSRTHNPPFAQRHR